MPFDEVHGVLERQLAHREDLAAMGIRAEIRLAEPGGGEDAQPRLAAHEIRLRRLQQPGRVHVVQDDESQRRRRVPFTGAFPCACYGALFQLGEDPSGSALLILLLFLRQRDA